MSSLVLARVKPEVMSPVGGHRQLRAAVEAFHARAKVGFENAELPGITRFLHERGVKGYVTFNVLVFDREMRAAQAQLLHLSECGVDAIIVQDIGVARLAARSRRPETGRWTQPACASSSASWAARRTT